MVYEHSLTHKYSGKHSLVNCPIRPLSPYLTNIRPATFFAYENALMVQALNVSHFRNESATLMRAINDYFWLESSGVYFQSSLSGSPSTVLSGWPAEILSHFANNESQRRALRMFHFIATTLTDQQTGAVYQDSYPDGSHRRYGDGTFFTLDCAYGLRYFAVAGRADLPTSNP